MLFFFKSTKVCHLYRLIKKYLDNKQKTRYVSYFFSEIFFFSLNEKACQLLEQDLPLFQTDSLQKLILQYLID